MEKMKINLDVLLPEVPNERDECVSKTIAALQNRKGIEKVHVVAAESGKPAQLCFHYEPEAISVSEIEAIAKEAGASVTEQYGHMLFDVSGIRHVRHARIVESSIKEMPGIVSVSVAASGFIQLEYKKSETNEDAISASIEKLSLRINNVDNFRKRKKEAHGHTHDDDTGAHKHDAGAHTHSHGGFFGEKAELIFAVTCGILLGIGFALSFGTSFAVFSIGCYVAAYFFGGFFTAKEAVETISKGKFEIDFLMLVAAIGAAALGQWLEGALLLFLFSLGHSLEHYAMEKARKSIAALTELAPTTALRKNGETLTETPVDDLQIGDVIVIKPNSKISADGVVVNGTSSVNQAPITGESMPVDKMAVESGIDFAKVTDARFKVFAGSINGNGTLEITVTKLAANSTIARLIELVNEAQTQKSPTQHFTDKLEKYYVPSVLGLVILLLFAFLIINEPFSASFYRAMAVLVAASPCALAISTPSAVLSGIARAAKAGVLVKGGKPLEEMGTLTAIAFDKTGTLTEGKPKLTGIYPLNGISEEELLEAVIAIEKLSDHPLAAAIVKGGTEKLKKDVSPASKVEAITGRGVRAEYNGSVFHIGNKELFTEKNHTLPEDVKAKVSDLEIRGNTTMLVQRGGGKAGQIDHPRPI